MRFLCVSDQIDPLVYSTSVKERYGDVDAVLCAGDLSMEYVDFITDTLGKPTFFVFGNHDLEEYDYYRKPFHLQADTPSDRTQMDVMRRGHSAEYVSNRVIRHKHLTFRKPDGKSTPLLIAGVSGSIRYNNGRCQFTNAQMALQLMALAPALLWNRLRHGRYLDILLTHSSPRRIHDREDPCHRGFSCFNRFIQRYAPAVLVHGHIHLYDLSEERVTKKDSTTIINAYSHIVFDYEPYAAAGKGESFVPDITIRPSR